MHRMRGTGMSNVWERIKPSKRKLVQLYSALLYNAYLKGFIKGGIYTGKVKSVCVPGFNCYSCPGAVGACPLGSLQDNIDFLFFLQFLKNQLRHQLIAEYNLLKLNLWDLKYVFLAVFVVFIPLYIGFTKDMTVPGFCKYICPAGTLEGAVGLLANPANTSLYGMLGIYFTRKFVILAVIGLACVFIYRAFCRFICPLGAIYGLFNKFALIGVKVDESSCTNCGLCVKKCKMDVLHVNDQECIQCGKCIDVCAKGAISLKAGKIVLKSSDITLKALPEEEKTAVTKKRKNIATIAWGIALAVLVFALVWFNFLDPASKTGVAYSPNTTAEEGETVIGFEPGQQLDDFTIECLDGSSFHLKDYRGKIVVLNLWATYCGPCVEELPSFCDFATKHSDDTVVLAVHHPLVTKPVEPFVKDHGWTIPVAVDQEDPRIMWDKVGGTDAMPQTIILDKNGIVIENHRGSLTPEMLEAYYAKAAEVEYKGEEAAE